MHLRSWSTLNHHNGQQQLRNTENRIQRIADLPNEMFSLKVLVIF